MLFVPEWVALAREYQLYDSLQGAPAVPEPKDFFSHCNCCNGSKRHDVLHEQITADSEVDLDKGIHEDWTTTYTMIQCRGCDDVSMRVVYWHSAYGSDTPEIYPPRISRKSPEWLWKLPADWWRLLREIYGALHLDSRRLAMMGARTLVDMYLTEAVGNSGSFAHRLDLLVASGQLAPDDKATLKAVLEAGNATSHRGYNPNAKDLGVVMDIVEHLLHRLLLKQSATTLQKSTPPRPSE